MSQLLSIQDLRVAFRMGKGVRAEAVKGVSFDIDANQTVALVGESGSGKSVTAMSVLNLLPDNAERTGRILWKGADLLGFGLGDLQKMRGKEIACVFQDPMSSLNPVMSVGAQIDDMVRRHTGASAQAARKRTVDLLRLVGIRDPARRVDDYPHQFSGGMRQRVMIAMAVSCEPDLLIADEPTTALDVTVQAQILRLLMRLRQELGMALMLITHDFGVIAGMVERVYVMLDGEIVESGPVDTLFAAPRHAYTRALLDAVPRLDSATRPA